MPRKLKIRIPKTLLIVVRAHVKEIHDFVPEYDTAKGDDQAYNQQGK